MLSGVRLTTSFSKFRIEGKRAIQYQVGQIFSLLVYFGTMTKSKRKKNDNFILKQRDI